MKKILTILTISALSFTACKSTKESSNNDPQALEGTWELTYIKDTPKPLAELYSEKMPNISITLNDKHITGNNGCNNFSGSFDIKENHVDFNKPMMATKRYCEGMGESVFMQNLSKSQTYSISKDKKTLQFVSGEQTIMKFNRK